jgi:GNAT superfamily N-acetyltransferase
MSDSDRFFDNREYGFGLRPLVGTTLSNRQHGDFEVNYSLDLGQHKDLRDEHHITVHTKDGRPIGSMRWDPDDGEIYHIDVASDHRRKGIATAMWRLGHQLSNEYGIQAPHHSRDRSDQGDAWAKTVGGELPPRINASAFPDLNSEPSPLARQLEEYARNQNS